VQLRPFALFLACLASCAGPPPRHSGTSVTTFRELLDSLVLSADCPLKQAPAAVLDPNSAMPLSPVETCALTAAAIQGLVKASPIEPYWAPGDTSRIVRAVVMTRITTPVDSSFNEAGPPDTIARVELDIEGRPKLVWFEFGLGAVRETMGAVHRGPPLSGTD